MKYLKKTLTNNITQFIFDFFLSIEEQIGNNYKISNFQFELKFRRFFYYHNQDRIYYIIDSLNPLREGKISIIIQQNNIIIVSKLNHKNYIIRSSCVGFVVASFLYLSFNLNLLQTTIIILSISSFVAIIGIILSEKKIHKIIEKAYRKTIFKQNGT